MCPNGHLKNIAPSIQGRKAKRHDVLLYINCSNTLVANRFASSKQHCLMYIQLVTHMLLPIPTHQNLKNNPCTLQQLLHIHSLGVVVLILQKQRTTGLDVLNRIRSLPNRSGKSVLTVIMTGPGWKGDKNLGPCQIENQNIMSDKTMFKVDGLDIQPRWASYARF